MPTRSARGSSNGYIVFAGANGNEPTYAAKGLRQDRKRSTAGKGQRLFRGAVWDTGAPRTVIGRVEAELYAQQHTGSRLKLSRDKKRTFRFGQTVTTSATVARILISIVSTVVAIVAHVVDIDIPLLIGLDVTREHGFDVMPTEGCLYHEPTDSKLPCVSGDSHIVTRWEPLTTFYARGQIARMHNHLLHPSTQKLYDMLRRAKPEEMTPETRGIIDEVTQTCQTWQELRRKPLSFSIRDDQGEIVFNQRLLLDLMFLDDRKPVLHIVDECTSFSTARFLNAETAEETWNTFVQAWATMYV
jgi:hypothetical protein